MEVAGIEPASRLVLAWGLSAWVYGPFAYRPHTSPSKPIHSPIRINSFVWVLAFYVGDHSPYTIAHKPDSHHDRRNSGQDRDRSQAADFSAILLY